MNINFQLGENFTNVSLLEFWSFLIGSTKSMFSNDTRDEQCQRKFRLGWTMHAQVIQKPLTRGGTLALVLT